ncbi:recombinase family protein [Cupriavidus pauculus]|uniref:recombinase family protein n=1 Tax=Cupriavidus pauculus TaxID=82633 RepID=UPI001246DEE9|nr:recombinase family protein [Cupriavidus pauculus]KAB0601165.1 recombinase family protein [Cupriavidus pauculus]UAK99166.1 recombinase family protein [Cupriavidus pauculus]
MTRIAYYRVSTADQSIEAQRAALGGGFDHEFMDEGVSGATQAAKRPGFAKLLEFIRKGDSLHVYAIDRLGRDSIDVQQTVRVLLDKGVMVEVRGLGQISATGAGGLLLALMAQMAELERERIRERTEAGRAVARASLAATGRTHRGKASLGRPVEHDAASIAAWRTQNKASIAETARHFGTSESTVKRAVRG